jgi:Zn-dependent protease
MSSSRQGTIHLFRFAGVDVYLHWLWFLIAIYEINGRTHVYSSILWNVLEYLALFVIVLLHEFGHALACKQVGGTANQIMLWPLGGIAFVSPPPRAGATLWSIAAGPLVNAVLVPILLVNVYASRSLGFISPSLTFMSGCAPWLISTLVC